MGGRICPSWYVPIGYRPSSCCGSVTVVHHSALMILYLFVLVVVAPIVGHIDIDVPVDVDVDVPVDVDMDGLADVVMRRVCADVPVPVDTDGLATTDVVNWVYPSSRESMVVVVYGSNETCYYCPNR